MRYIVAVDARWGIGKRGDLLLSIPDDMRYFRESTRGKVLVMGYNTLRSFPGGRPLPGRLNIVLADIEGLRVEGAVVCRTMDQLMRLIANFRSDDVYVIGGGMMYRQLMPYCDAAYITKMRFDGDADTFIPNLDEIDGWRVADESEIFDYDGIAYSFVTYHNDTPVPVDFSGASTDMARYFMKRPALPDDMPEDCRTRAYRHPLPDGFSAEDVERFFGSQDVSFEHYLRDNGLVVAPEDLGLTED